MTIPRMFRGLVIALALVCPLADGGAYAQSDEFDVSRTRISDLLIEHNIPSAAVAVAKDGEVIWSEGFGLANVAQKRHATGDTVYSLASISKPVTATAIMMLVDRGLIDLDAPINDYLGEEKLVAYIGNAEDATVRRVMNHTAGLPLYYNFYYADEDHPRPGMDETISRYGKIVMIPGETAQYSNLGYGLLEYVIERLSGVSYADFLEKELFEPLGMDASFVPPEHNLPSDTAIRYSRDGSVIPFYDFDHRGASAIFMSAEDLVSFGLFHIAAGKGESDLLSAEAAIAMRTPSVDIEGSTSRYGLGFGTELLNGHFNAVHGGGMPGVRGELSVLTDDDMVVAVLLNKTAPGRGEIVNEVLRAVAPETLMHVHGDAAPAALYGAWSGRIAPDTDDALPIELLIGDDGEVSGIIGDHPLLFRGLRQAENGFVEIYLENSDLPFGEAQRYPHRLMLKLKPRGNTLNGYATARGRPTADRGGSAISYWTSLSRETSDQ